jgi:hypothetical protein
VPATPDVNDEVEIVNVLDATVIDSVADFV